MNKKSSDQRPAAKPYKAPRLILYGDVRELTRSVDKNTTKDGGPNNFKT